MMLTTFKKLVRLLLLSLFVFGSTSCDDKTYSLRSEDYDFYYTINNQQAARRVASIMHNRSDTANPVERFKLVHISDAHISERGIDNHYEYPNNLIEAVKFANQGELRIDAMVSTGDNISFAKKNRAMDYLNSFFTHLYVDNRIPTFPCYGNHDSNMEEHFTSEYISSSELATAFNNRGNYPLQRPAGKNYYYADVRNPMGGTIRIIALDMTDQPSKEYNTVQLTVYSKEQVDWFGNVALKEGMTANHSVIVLVHYPLQRRDERAITYLTDGNFLHTWMLIPEIVEAFRSKTTIHKTFENILNKAERMPVDFDFSDSPGEFICYLGGHAHVFAHFELAQMRNRNVGLLPQQMILCTNMAPANAGRTFNRVVRRETSIISNSFNIYAIDTRERKIYITFFGAYIPSDNSEFPDVIELSY